MPDTILHAFAQQFPIPTAPHCHPAKRPAEEVSPADSPHARLQRRRSDRGPRRVVRPPGLPGGDAGAKGLTISVATFTTSTRTPSSHRRPRRWPPPEPGVGTRFSSGAGLRGSTSSDGRSLRSGLHADRPRRRLPRYSGCPAQTSHGRCTITACRSTGSRRHRRDRAARCRRPPSCCGAPQPGAHQRLTGGTATKRPLATPDPVRARPRAPSALISGPTQQIESQRPMSTQTDDRPTAPLPRRFSGLGPMGGVASSTNRRRWEASRFFGPGPRLTLPSPSQPASPRP